MNKQDFRHNILSYYCLIWLLLFVFKWSNDMLLYQQQPAFIYNTFDVVSWLFLQTHLPQWLLQSKQFLFFDIIYYTAPFFVWIISRIKPGWVTVAAIYLLLVNWIYLQCYFVYPISSYTIFVAWLIFPVVFIPANETTGALLFCGLRYFFLYFFLSAGLWKLVNGSAFNPVQLSGILLDQHKEMLTNSPHYWLSELYQWLISHTTVSYALFLLVMLMELSFAIGFFTQRFDRYLIVIYLIFLLADYWVMRIPYFETLPFLLTLRFHPIHSRSKNTRFFQNA